MRTLKPQLNCPFCPGTASIMEEQRESIFHETKVTILMIFYKCEKCKKTFTTLESDVISTGRAYEKYLKIKSGRKDEDND